MTTLDLRRIGGSDMCALLLGSDPWGKTALDVYLRVVEGISLPSSPAMEKGKLFERPIGDWWAKREGLEVRWVGASILPEDRPWQRATPDLTFHRGDWWGIGDVKRYRDVRLSCGEPGTDQIGHYELIQLHTYAEAMEHVGIGRPDSLALIVHDLYTDDLVDYRADYEPELGARIVEAAEKFWRNHVEPKVPPPMNGGRTARAWLESRYPRPTREAREATAVETAHALRLREIQAEIRRLEKESDAITNELRASIAEAEKVTGEWGSITWTCVEGGPVSYVRRPYRALKTNFRREKKSG